MPEAVDDANQDAAVEPGDHVDVSGHDLPLERGTRGGPVDRKSLVTLGAAHRPHFFMVTVVPLPSVVASSNSSISRFAPGNPMPRLLPVE